MDSNSSFPLMSTLSRPIDFAAIEIFRHMLDFKSSMACIRPRQFVVYGIFFFNLNPVWDSYRNQPLLF